MVIKTYKRVFFRHWLDTFRYWNNWCFFLTDTCDTLNDRCLIGTYWTLWVKCLLVGHRQCIRHSTFQMLCTCRTLRLKKCYFVWHLKRFGVLSGWTCTSLRQICAFGLDTCKSFGPKGLYWFNSFYITNLIVYFTQYYYWNTGYLSTTLLDTHLCIFHEYVTTSLYIHWCHIVGNPKQIWNFWQLANKLKFSCSPWIMHALFQLDASHFCEENPTNHVYTDYCMHASEIIFVLIYP